MSASRHKARHGTEDEPLKQPQANRQKQVPLNDERRGREQDRTTAKAGDRSRSRGYRAEMKEPLERASSYGVFGPEELATSTQTKSNLNSGSFAAVAAGGTRRRTNEASEADVSGNEPNDTTMKASISKEKKNGPKYKDAKLIFADINHIPWRRQQQNQLNNRTDPNKEQNEKIEILAETLNKRNLWKDVDGIHLRRGRFIHLRMSNAEMAEDLVQTPLEVLGTSLQFRHVTHSGTLVSIMGLPLGYPLTWVRDELAWFGVITRLYRLKRNIFGRAIETATVMVLFEKMNEPIPHDLYFNSQTIHAKYSGQEEELERWKEEQELIRLDQEELKRNEETLRKEIEVLERTNMEEDAACSPIMVDEASVNQMLHYDPEKRKKEGIDFSEEVLSNSELPERDSLMETREKAARKRNKEEATISDPEVVPGKTSKGASHCDPKVDEKKRSMAFIGSLKEKKIPDPQHFAVETVKSFPTTYGFKAITQTLFNISRKVDDKIDFQDVMASILSLANSGETAETSFELCANVGKGVTRRCKVFRENTEEAFNILKNILTAIWASK